MVFYDYRSEENVTSAEYQTIWLAVTAPAGANRNVKLSDVLWKLPAFIFRKDNLESGAAIAHENGKTTTADFP